MGLPGVSLYDNIAMMSSHPASERKKAVTVRVPARRLRTLLRARKLSTQSELINVLLLEEEERLASRRVLDETAGSVRRGDFDDRLL